MKKQVNAQLDDSDRAVLEAVAFLRNVLLVDIAREALMEYIESRRNEPRVQAVLAARAAEIGGEAGVEPACRKDCLNPRRQETQKDLRGVNIGRKRQHAAPENTGRKRQRLTIPDPAR